VNASDALIKTLVANGLEVIFANPGTSEMQLVVSIDNNQEIRPVLGLFEGVLTGDAIISDFINGKPVTDLIR
tara:strand:- start:134 stop:349 length:216 start_codon:yes stop_codon:yes gene_type:complete